MRLLVAACSAALLLGVIATGAGAAEPSKRPATSANGTSAAALRAAAKTHIPDAAFRAACVNVKGKTALSVVVPACSYLASLVSHDGSKILIADDAWRLENGKNTGTSGPEIKTRVTGSAYDVIGGLRDVRWFIVDDDEAIAYYVLDIKDVPTIKSVLLTERFKVADGLLEEIEAVFDYCGVTAVNAAAPDGTEICSQPAE